MYLILCWSPNLETLTVNVEVSLFEVRLIYDEPYHELYFDDPEEEP